MNRARDSSETNQYSSVPGHDQPSSGGSSEAPPRLCMDQSVACTPSREVCATRWGTAEQHHFEAAGCQLQASRTHRDTVRATDTRFVA